MKFPGRRKTKHYFPITERDRSLFALQSDFKRDTSVYVVGIDQLLVDIEINVTDEFLKEHNFSKGQSFLIDDELADKIYYDFKKQGNICGEYPGGAVGNTLHNFSVLSDTKSVALGSIKKVIEVGVVSNILDFIEFVPISMDAIFILSIVAIFCDNHILLIW